MPLHTAFSRGNATPVVRRETPAAGNFVCFEAAPYEKHEVKDVVLVSMGLAVSRLRGTLIQMTGPRVLVLMAIVVVLPPMPVRAQTNAEPAGEQGAAPGAFYAGFIRRLFLDTAP